MRRQNRFRCHHNIAFGFGFARLISINPHSIHAKGRVFHMDTIDFEIGIFARNSQLAIRIDFILTNNCMPYFDQIGVWLKRQVISNTN